MGARWRPFDRARLDGRTTRHPGYVASRRLRKRIEEIFEWLKAVALMRKQRHRGLARVRWLFIFAVALYNLAVSGTSRPRRDGRPDTAA